MLHSQGQRFLGAYVAIYLACHRQHLRSDEGGNPITAHQASVLDHLDATRATTLSKLAEHMGVGRSTMSITVARLMRRGYIARRRDKVDRRRSELTLTPAGMRVREQNTVLDPALMNKMFRLMRADELEESLAAIARMANCARILLQQRKRRRDG